MAKFAINREGAEHFRELSNNLKASMNYIQCTNKKLQNNIMSLIDDLGIYGIEIWSILLRVNDLCDSNSDEIAFLSEKLLAKSFQIEELIGLTSSLSALDNKENTNQRLTPIANVIPGTPMDFAKADSGSVNPNYGKDHGYAINCQSCVVVFEARLRGYDVQVLPNRPGSVLEALSRDTSMAWIDPSTGKQPKYIFDETKRTPEEYLDFINEVVEKGGRYTIEFAWRGRGNAGHIVNLDRTPNGLLRIKDNQRGNGEKSEWIGDFEVLNYLYGMKYEEHFLFGTRPCVPQLLRIDNLDFNYNVVEQIMKGN